MLERILLSVVHMCYGQLDKWPSALDAGSVSSYRSTNIRNGPDGTNHRCRNPLHAPLRNLQVNNFNITDKDLLIEALEFYVYRLRKDGCTDASIEAFTGALNRLEDGTLTVHGPLT